MKLLRWSFIILILAAACTPYSTAPLETTTAVSPTVVSTIHPLPTATVLEAHEPAWWETAIFYEIFVRSFYDSNGDGNGDFNGITAKLDTLNDGDPATDTDLGITAIWLMPIFPSPSYHGYDVTDYYAVNPQYGTMEDFNHLLRECHDRGIRVIIDLVLNHTSSQNPWFIQSNENMQSAYRDWYVWSAEDPGPDAPGWWPGLTGFYYAYFDAGMPDLNYHNPAVTEEVTRMLNFWLKEIGVDGFRIDAAKHLFEEGNKRENVPETYAWFEEFYRTYKAINPQSYIVGEVSGAGARLVDRYTGDKMDMVFNFEMASGIVNSTRGEAASGINSAIQFTLMDMPSWQFATFLTNHDQDRVMSVLNNSVEKAKVAASILMTLPGTPFIYYGEEIGMRGIKPDEDIRRPMQWTDEVPKAGFTSGVPWRQPDIDNLSANVTAESADSESLWNHYRRLIALRKDFFVAVSPQVELVSTENPGVYALLRIQTEDSILTLINLSGAEISDYQLALKDSALADGKYAVHSLWADEEPYQSLVVASGNFNEYKPVEILAPYSTHIYQLKSD